MVSEFECQYEEKQKQICEERIELLQGKQLAVLAAQEICVKQKEQLTQITIKYGLWQSFAEISDSLHELKSTRTEMFKTQPNFHKKVLQQVYTSKQLFFSYIIIKL